MGSKRWIKGVKNMDNNRKNTTNINWYPGHMAKTKRLVKENLNLIDLVYEVLDARMPYSSKIVDLDEVIGTKPRILIFNKMDLCDVKETKKWMEYYQEKGYFVLGLDLKQDTNLKPLFQLTEQVMQSKQQGLLDKGMKTRRIRTLVVGIPNVGKSTLINRLVGKKATTVGNKPGVTEQLSWIRISDTLELLDSPGILWPKFTETTTALNLASLSAIKEEVLPLDEVVFYILKTLEQYYPAILKERYGIEILDEDIIVSIEAIGRRRGCLLRGGEIDYEKVYAIILNDLREGYVKGITFDRFVPGDENE